MLFRLLFGALFVCSAVVVAACGPRAPRLAPAVAEDVNALTHVVGLAMVDASGLPSIVGIEVPGWMWAPIPAIASEPDSAFVDDHDDDHDDDGAEVDEEELALEQSHVGGSEPEPDPGARCRHPGRASSQAPAIVVRSSQSGWSPRRIEAPELLGWCWSDVVKVDLRPVIRNSLIVEDMLIVRAADETGLLWVHAIDLATGERRWSQQVAGTFAPTARAHVRSRGSTLIRGSGTSRALFVSSSSDIGGNPDMLSRLHLDTGAVAWSVYVTKTHEYGGTVVLHGDLLLLEALGHRFDNLDVLEPETGYVRRRIDGRLLANAGPDAVFVSAKDVPEGKGLRALPRQLSNGAVVAGEPVLVSRSQSGLQGWSSTTGKLLWEQSLLLVEGLSRYANVSAIAVGQYGVLAGRHILVMRLASPGSDHRCGYVLSQLDLVTGQIGATSHHVCSGFENWQVSATPRTRYAFRVMAASDIGDRHNIVMLDTATGYVVDVVEFERYRDISDLHVHGDYVLVDHDDGATLLKATASGLELVTSTHGDTELNHLPGYLAELRDPLDPGNAVSSWR